MTTEFSAIPWDVYTANNGNLDGLPDKDWASFGGPCCDAEWAGPTDQPDEGPWMCCLPAGHSGAHCASDSVSVLAEWNDGPVNTQ